MMKFLFSSVTTKFSHSHLTLQQMSYCGGRRKAHREEVVRLQQQLKSTAMTSKGGAVEADRFKKDLEKTRCRPHANSLSQSFIEAIRMKFQKDRPVEASMLPMQMQFGRVGRTSHIISG